MPWIGLHNSDEGPAKYQCIRVGEHRHSRGYSMFRATTCLPVSFTRAALAQSFLYLGYIPLASLNNVALAGPMLYTFSATYTPNLPDKLSLLRLLRQQ